MLEQTVAAVVREDPSGLDPEGQGAVLPRMLSEIFVVRAQPDPSSDAIEYTGVSRHFDELGEGERIPLYLIRISIEDVCGCGATSWRWSDEYGEMVCEHCGEFQEAAEREASWTFGRIPEGTPWMRSTF